MRPAATIAPLERNSAPHFENLEPGLRRLVGQRRGHTALLAGSADDAWRDVLAQTLAPGDTVLAVRVGPASATWVTQARDRGLDVETLDAPAGEGLPALDVSHRLEADHEGRIRAVFVRYSEPGTGVRSSIAAVRDALDAADHGALLLIDASDTLPAMAMRKEDWGVDVLIAAGGILPNDTVLCATSLRVAPAFDDAAVSAAGLRQLERRLDALFAEGLDAVRHRYGRYAEATRRAIRAWGLTPCAADPRCYSASTTVARLSEAERKARYVAIDHGNALDDDALLARIADTEKRLRTAGLPIAQDAGVGAAAGWLQASGTTTSLRAVA